MEKYGAFRDKGSGIAPFFPVPTQPAGVALPFHLFLFVVRIPLLFSATLAYFLLFSWLPIGTLGKKAALWVILGVPGIWWVDLQVDGVKKGSLGKYHQARLPHPGSIIASSFTSPIDALYLSAIFDPLFTRSFPNSRKVQPISLWQAMLYALTTPPTGAPADTKLTDLATLARENPDRCIAVFPEATTTNGRGILPFNPALLTIPATTKIFPISLRYTPADITTPVPGAYMAFLWNLCSKPTHCIRVRIAEYTFNTSSAQLSPVVAQKPRRNSYETNLLDDLHAPAGRTSGPSAGRGKSGDAGVELNDGEIKVLDKIAEALARLGRVKRVGLGVEDKVKFVQVWSKRR